MIIAVLGRAGNAIIGVALISLLTRALGPGAFGQYRVAVTFAAFGTIAANLGLFVVVVREIARPGRDAAAVVGNALTLSLAATATLAVATTAVAALLPYAWSVVLAVAVAAGARIAGHVAVVLNGVFANRLAQGRATLAETCGQLATLALTALAALLGGGALAMTAAMAAGLVLNAAMAYAFARRLLPFRLSVDPAEWRTLVRLGFPIGLSGLFLLLTLRIDTLVLSLTQPDRAVGLYGLGSRMLEVVLGLLSLLGGLLMGSLAKAAADRALLRERLRAALGPMAAIGIGGAVMLIFYAPEVVRLVAGTAFEEASRPVAILAVGMGVAAIGTVFRMAAIALDRQNTVALADLLVLLVTTVAILLLVPRYSYNGAAVAAVLAQVSSAIFCAAIARRAGLSLPLGGLGGCLAAGGLTAAALWMLRATAMPWPLGCAIGAAFYAALLLATGAIPVASVRALIRPPRGA
jgi:O-antigen/teichoic acid export membrane protein